MRIVRGQSVQILYSSDAGELIRLAALELQEHLTELGFEVTASGKPGFAGLRFLLECYGPADSGGSLHDQGEIRVKTIDSSTMLLAGKTTRDVLDAVYTFLEDLLGVVWFNDRETYLPPAEEWNLGEIDHQFSPPFVHRSMLTASSLSPKWSARKRLNYFSDEPHNHEPILAGCTFFAGEHCHNLYKLLSLGFFGLEENPLTHGEDKKLIEKLNQLHPEFFALINNERKAYRSGVLNADLSDQSGNISLTNLEVRKILVNGARLLLDHHPEARLISFSLRDNYHYCEEALRSEGGVLGALIDLVNAIALELEHSHPAARIDFLAYHGTQRPPLSGRLHHNVIVRYCPIRISQYHAFDESEHNLKGGLNYETPPSMSQPLQQIKQWSAVADQVVVWYYTLSLPYFHPQPSLRGHARTVRALVDHGVSGLYIQDNQPMALNSFNDLRVHLLSRLLWNPQLDEIAERERFCRLYYGGAWQAVLAYIDLLHEERCWDWQNWPDAEGVSKWGDPACEESWRWFGDVPGPDFPKPHFYTLYRTRPPLKEEFFREGVPILARAWAAVQGQSVFERRLEEVQMGFCYAVLSYPGECEDLVAEADQWLRPRFEALRQLYVGSNFHGLDRVGLSYPQPLLVPADALS